MIGLGEGGEGSRCRELDEWYKAVLASDRERGEHQVRKGSNHGRGETGNRAWD